MFLLLRPQLGVLVLQVQDHADPGEVQPGRQQVADPAQPLKVMGAVAAGPAVGPGGIEQPPGLIQAQRLGAHADQLRRDGDAVHATPAVWAGPIHHTLPSSSSNFGSCLSMPHVLQQIYSSHHTCQSWHGGC